MSDGIQVVQTRCYYCNEPDALLINKRIGRHSSELQEMHDKVIDTEPCSKCKEHMDKGIILVSVDDAKSDKGWQNDPMPNPYRTGGFFVVSENFIRRVFQPEAVVANMLESRFAFIDHEAAVMLGLFEAAKKEQDNG